MIGPEQTMVDGILELRQQLVKSRHQRLLEVVKFRGSSVLYGAHSFRIGDDGVAVFPHLEAVTSPVLSRSPVAARISTGVPGLDEMLDGGYPVGSVTAITGPEGAGKTLLGLQFLSNASELEPALLFGLDESGEMAEEVGEVFGIDLDGLSRKGALRLEERSRVGESLDEAGYRLLECGEEIRSAAFVHRWACFAHRESSLRRAGCCVLCCSLPRTAAAGSNQPFLGSIETARQRAVVGATPVAACRQ